MKVCKLIYDNIPLNKFNINIFSILPVFTADQKKKQKYIFALNI